MFLSVFVIALFVVPCTAQEQNQTKKHPCDGLCLNGGRCWKKLDADNYFCYCQKGYIGYRCETFRGSCPEVYFISNEKCEGKVCTNDKDCIVGQCCLSACGQKLCTNAKDVENWINALVDRRIKVGRMVGYNQPSDWRFNTVNKWGVEEDRNSPYCKGFCLNNGRCMRIFPDDVLTCHCSMGFSGKRCQTKRFPCPEIDPTSFDKCEGTPCYYFNDCEKPGEQCCPSACGDDRCITNNTSGIQLYTTTESIVTERVGHNLDSTLEQNKQVSLAQAAVDGTNGVKEDTKRHPCDGLCLNGGRCWKRLDADNYFCYCPKGYIGYRCETFRGSCPEVYFISNEKCEGKICSDNQDCIDQGGQCCLSACGQKLCTNAKDAENWLNAVYDRRMRLDRMIGYNQPSDWRFSTVNTWGIDEDPNSPYCKGFCLNGRCMRNFPDDDLSCNCYVGFTGKRCQTKRFSCPKIDRTSAGKCEGTPCNLFNDCEKPREQCCPSACGETRCITNKTSGIQLYSTSESTVTERDGQNLESTTEQTKPENLDYAVVDGTDGDKEDQQSNMAVDGMVTNKEDRRRQKPEKGRMPDGTKRGKKPKTGKNGKRKKTGRKGKHNRDSKTLRKRSCDGFCLNGGRCLRPFENDTKACKCRKRYTGKRCELLRGSCPVLNGDSAEICKGTFCSFDKECVNHGEKCCPSACGFNICTSFNRSAVGKLDNMMTTGIMTTPESQRGQDMKENGVNHTTAPEVHGKSTIKVSWTSCRENICMNGGYCQKHFYLDVQFCVCPSLYKGERCEQPPKRACGGKLKASNATTTSTFWVRLAVLCATAIAQSVWLNVPKGFI